MNWVAWVVGYTSQAFYFASLYHYLYRHPYHLYCRTAHYNLAKLRDVYLHTNTLAALANLAPHMSGARRRHALGLPAVGSACTHVCSGVCMHVCLGWLQCSPGPSRAGLSCTHPATQAHPMWLLAGLSTHAAQRLVSLFHLLARRYSRLQAAAEGMPPPPTPNDLLSPSLESPLTPWTPAASPAPGPDAPAAAPQQQQGQQGAAGAEAAGQGAGVTGAAGGSGEAPAGASEAAELELQLYADFLRIVLEVGAPRTCVCVCVCV